MNGEHYTVLAKKFTMSVVSDYTDFMTRSEENFIVTNIRTVKYSAQ
jgi:hypothetical protein